MGKLPKLQRLFLHGNPKLGLTDEVLGPTWASINKWQVKRANPRVILDFYFSRQQEGEGPLNQVKLLLVGRGEAGKTSVSRALRREMFSKEQRETPGIEIKPWDLACPPNENVMVHLWDLAGQEILHETHRFFLTDRSLYLVVLDGRGGQQMEEAEYWLSHVQKYGSRGDEHSPVIVVLNKWDSPGPYDVEQRRLQRQYPNIKAFVKTDCKTSSGIDALRETICAVVEQMPGVRQMWPASYKRVANELRRRCEHKNPAQRRHFLSWQDYRQVCVDCGVKEQDRQHYLAENLNALGIALYYGDDGRPAGHASAEPQLGGQWPVWYRARGEPEALPRKAGAAVGRGVRPGADRWHGGHGCGTRSGHPGLPGGDPWFPAGPDGGSRAGLSGG